MSIGTSPVVPPRAYRAQPGAIWTAIVLICATITALAAAFTAFMLYMRPVLKVCICTSLWRKWSLRQGPIKPGLGTVDCIDLVDTATNSMSRSIATVYAQHQVLVHAD